MPKVRTKEELIKQTYITEDEVKESVHSISCSYLLNSLANEYMERTDEIMKKRGMCINDIKMMSSMYRDAFNNYNAKMKEMFTLDKGGMCDDYEKP